jgi:hypothetical protein
MEAERAFGKAMVELSHEAKREGYTPTYFLRMTSEIGPLATAKQLINSDTPSEGFARLYELDRLDLSVEALALRPEWRDLFTPDERKRAHVRLSEYGFRT